MMIVVNEVCRRYTFTIADFQIVKFYYKSGKSVT